MTETLRYLALGAFLLAAPALGQEAPPAPAPPVEPELTAEDRDILSELELFDLLDLLLCLDLFAEDTPEKK